MSIRTVGKIIAFSFALAAALLLPARLFAQENDYPLALPPASDGGDSEPQRFVGNYCGAFGGISLHDDPVGEFTVDVPGTPVAAYLYWSGRDSRDATGDLTLDVAVNGAAAQTVTADVELVANSQGRFRWFTYSYDALSLLQSGPNTLNVSGFGVTERHGAGLLVVYKNDETCPYQQIDLFFGNDVLFKGWDGPSGPDSEVACINFPAPPEAIEIDIQMFVGGIENPNRSDAIWYTTGTETQPTNLVDEPFATALDEQFARLGADEFDNYDTFVQDPEPLMVDAGDTWACFQIESPDPPNPDKTKGISATWINLAVRTPLASIAIEPDGVNPINQAHTFTVTVDSSIGFNSLVITPTVQPAPDFQSDTCAAPVISGSKATCTVTINSPVTGIFTATAQATLDLGGGLLAELVTNGLGNNSPPAVKEYIPGPAIDIEKLTNGNQADGANDSDVPQISAGDTVTWTYLVTNIGTQPFTKSEVIVTDDQGVTPIWDPTSDDGADEILSPAEVWRYQAVGTALNLMTGSVTVKTVPGCDPGSSGISSTTYENIGAVTVGELVDSDPSHYCNPSEPDIDIEKATNGEDADDPTGPMIEVSDPVNWTYAVTNTGNVTLTEITVTDSKGVSVTCPKTELAPQESMNCTANGIAVEGQYANMGAVTGKSPDDQTVDDDDPSHYFGYLPAAIGDFVFGDVDPDGETPAEINSGNGLQDEGERGVDGVIVQLYSAEHELIAQTATTDGGQYIFTELPPGEYYLVFINPFDEGLWTIANIGDDDSVDSDGDSFLEITVETGVDGDAVRTEIITLESGDFDRTWDVGLVGLTTAASSALGDRIWLDKDEDGVQDSVITEPGMADLVVKLYRIVTEGAAGEFLTEMATGEDGIYLFEGLDPGNYYVELMAPEDHSISPRQAGGDPTADSDMDPETLRTEVFYLPSFFEDRTWDGGLFQSPTSVGEGEEPIDPTTRLFVPLINR